MLTGGVEFADINFIRFLENHDSNDYIIQICRFMRQSRFIKNGTK